MQDLGGRFRPLVWPTYLNYVEKMGCRRLFHTTEISSNGSSHDPFFALIHRLETGHQGGRRSGFDLHKDQNLAVLRNQIDLVPSVTRVSPITSYGAKSMILA